MKTLWEKIQALEGEGLLAICEGDPSKGELFTVATVDDEQVKIEVGPRMVPISIPRKRFERAENLGLVAPDIAAEQLRDSGIFGNRSTYAAAIIRETFD